MPRVLSRHRPLLVRNGALFASRGLDLHVSRDHGRSFTRFASCNLSRLRRTASRVRLFERIGRLGFHALRETAGGALVGIVRGRVVRRGADGGDFRPVLEVPRGSRPLDLCVDPRGRLYFGEYFSNPGRERVHVYGSRDGREWDVVHTFPAGSIRHVHGIVGDPVREGVWVLTGDDDDECGLWFTDDDFRTLDPVVRGSQRYRAVSVIPTEEGLLLPTDSPRVRNWIQRLSLPDLRLDRLEPLPGSAFSAVRSGGFFLVSTAAEPSPVNRARSSAVYVSADGEDWRRVATFAPDVLSRACPFARRALRYPEVSLVADDGSVPFSFGFGRSVRGAEGRLVRWSSDELRDRLREPRVADR